MVELDPASLSGLLKYDPLTGSFEWLPRTPEAFKRPSDAKRWNANFAGRPALTAINSEGYRTGIIQGVAVKAHRVAWAIEQGSWPVGKIDHVNGDRTDNRLANLRDVTHTANQRNAKLQKNSTTGVCGVYWMADRNKWRAEITHDGLTQHLGQFATKQEAENARLAANDRAGFSERHGRTA